MAIATVTIDDADPDFQFHTEVEMDNPHIADMCWCVRRRNPDKRPPVLDANGQPTFDADGQMIRRDLTNAECIRFMLGGMLAGWSQAAAIDKAEEARLAVPPVVPGQWKVIA